VAIRLAVISKIALVALLAVILNPAGGAVAQPSRRASTTVSIRIDPIAEISFPQGTGFAIFVPPSACLPSFNSRKHGCLLWSQYWWPPIAPVRIPFVVKGNALATVSARPDTFVRISSGRYLGRAVHSGEQLGYHVIVQFPLPSNSYHWLLDWTEWSDWGLWNHWGGYGSLPAWSKIAQLPGLNGVGTPPLTSSIVDRGGTAYGVIYIVTAHGWTIDGRRAGPGIYHGSIQVTVGAASL
jgi:hypothetical protein